MAGLIPINDARAAVLAAVPALPAEEVALDDALGRVLAADVTSPIDVPPFDPSAMDGYAVVAGPAAELPVVGESRAGRPAGEPLAPGTAIRISTGALVPPGPTAVVPVERTERVARGSAAARGAEPEAAGTADAAAIGDTVRVPATEAGDHVRRRGEDVRAGDTIAGAGTVLGPAAIGSLASIGLASVPVARRPRVAVVVTGDELTPPGEPLAPGAIYSSNGVALAAQAEASGAVVASTATVGDDAATTHDRLREALDCADVVLISGGVSVGPHDHVKGALAELGVEQRFWGVALQPGKPTWFGTRDGALVFGLPGNPVSALVTFLIFARPAIAALQGADPDAVRTTATLTEAVARRPNRDQAVRVALALSPGGWRATPTGPQGSHVLSSLAKADALALVPAGPEPAPAGETVEVELL